MGSLDLSFQRDWEGYGRKVPKVCCVCGEADDIRLDRRVGYPLCFDHAGMSNQEVYYSIDMIRKGYDTKSVENSIKAKRLSQCLK